MLKDRDSPSEFALAASSSDSNTVYFFVASGSDMSIVEFNTLITDSSNDPSAKLTDFGSLFITRAPGVDHLYYIAFTSRWGYVLVMEIDRNTSSSSSLAKKHWKSSISNDYDGLY